MGTGNARRGTCTRVEQGSAGAVGWSDIDDIGVAASGKDAEMP